MPTERIPGELAQEIIKRWKSDENEDLVKKHGNIIEFAIHSEVENMWNDPATRAEFSNDKSILESWVRHRHLHTACGGSVSTFNKNDYNLE